MAMPKSGSSNVWCGDDCHQSCTRVADNVSSFVFRLNTTIRLQRGSPPIHLKSLACISYDDHGTWPEAFCGFANGSQSALDLMALSSVAAHGSCNNVLDGGTILIGER
jgi:hypothetical protein